MATIDASIPLQVQQPKDPLQSYAETLQLAQGIQSFQGQQALREAFANSDTSTPEGQQALIKRVGAVNPTEALTLQGQFGKQRQTEATIAKDKAQTAKANWEVGAKAMEVISNVGSSVMMTYADLLHKGVPEPQARQIVSQAIPSIKAHLKAQRDPQGNPLFNAEQIDQIPDQFDPQSTMATVQDAKARQEYYTQQHQNETLEQQKKHQGVEERQGAAKIGIEAQNSSINAGKLAEERRYHNAELNKPQSDIGKLAEDHKNGKISQKEYDDAIQKKTAGGDQETNDAVAQMIADGQIPPLSGYSMATPAGQKIMARVHEINPKYDAKTYHAEQTAETQFTSGKLGSTVRSLNVATDHLDALDKLGKDLQNGSMQDFNRFAQAFSARTGGPAPTNFDAAKKIVADEVVKAIVGSGGGVADREEAAKAFDKVSSPAQLAGAIAVAKRLMKGQLGGLKKQYKASTGKDDFDTRFLSGGAQGIEDAGGATKSGGDFSHLWN